MRREWGGSTQGGRGVSSQGEKGARTRVAHVWGLRDARIVRAQDGCRWGGRDAYIHDRHMAMGHPPVHPPVLDANICLLDAHMLMLDAHMIMRDARDAHMMDAHRRDAHVRDAHIQGAHMRVYWVVRSFDGWSRLVSTHLPL